MSKAIIFSDYQNICKYANDREKLLIEILTKTAIRISEVKRYLIACNENLNSEFVKIQPLKRNNVRLVPNLFYKVPKKGFKKSLRGISMYSYTNRRRLKKLSKISNVKFTAHDFRETTITNLSYNMTIHCLIKITGHKHYNSLIRYYINKLHYLEQLDSELYMMLARSLYEKI